MPTLKLADGVTVEYPDPPGGYGWVRGDVIDGDTGSPWKASYHLFIRPQEHGGGVFTELREGPTGLVNAETGEATVHFNNRLWTLTEEKEHIARIKAEDTR